MRLVLDPAEDVAHGDWLRTVPGAYEWWYFDTVSDDGQWALTCIWFLGNPFSPYYRLSAQKRGANPFTHNALFFALYRYGQLHAYHFTRFAPALIHADETRPAALQFGPNVLSSEPGYYDLRLSDENANGRRLRAFLSFQSPPITVRGAENDLSPDDHCWLPAAPACRVRAEIALREVRNAGQERITFTGQGYHDHNWGTLPFATQIRDWYWARLSLGGGRAFIVYHVDYHEGPPVSHLLHFDRGQLVFHDAQAQIELRRRRRNGFGTAYATELMAVGGGLSATLRLGRRLDSAPFYVRTLCEGEVREGEGTRRGNGLAEYFRPRMLSWPLVASATKARMVSP